MRDPILSDKKVRQALSFAVDYDDMLNNIQHGLASRTVGPINPSKPYYAKDLALYTYNIEKAKALLSEAGWTDTDKDGVADKVIRGKKTDLVLSLMVTAGHPTSDLVAASLQNSMGKVGIKVEIKPTELPTINKETKAGNFQLATTASAMFPGWAELDQNYHSQNVPPKGDNRPGLVNKELDGLTEQIRTSQNETERTAMYIRAQEIIHDEVPEIFLYAPVYRFVLNKRFDYVLSPLSPPYSAHASKLKK
jgi:peptide/nickel transport system substrate-binding protein